MPVLSSVLTTSDPPLKSDRTTEATARVTIWSRLNSSSATSESTV